MNDLFGDGHLGAGTAHYDRAHRVDCEHPADVRDASNCRRYLREILRRGQVREIDGFDDLVFVLATLVRVIAGD